LCDPTWAVHGLVAEQGVSWPGWHLVLHPTWATHPTCYLEDLYVAKLWRGGGVARRLIEAVYAFGDGAVGHEYSLLPADFALISRCDSLPGR
jgi:GNAT superfamily N-acetyltransferase